MDGSKAIDAARLQRALEGAYARARATTGGEVAAYIPELARANADALAIAACTVEGRVHAVGDEAFAFTMQSLSKPFSYGLALERHGATAVHRVVGVEPSGQRFDSIISLESGGHRPHNPMENAGAIATSGLLGPGDRTARLSRLLAGLAAFAGRDGLEVDLPVALSEARTGHRNRALAHLMAHFGILAPREIDETLEVYFQQCAVLADVRDLAVMAATLAHGGVNPVTGARVLSAAHAGHVLCLMATCGLYDGAGTFLLRAGVPAKSGVSGGIIAVAPGRLGLAAFSPPLDAGGNSVRAGAALVDLCDSLELHAFEPGRGVRGAAVSVAGPDELVRRIHAELADERSGEVSRYLPDLADVDPELFGIAVATVDGDAWVAGDVDRPFTLQSAANPFTYGLALQERGADVVHACVGTEPSGNPYNAVVFDPRTRRPYNAMVNAGAIAVCSLIPGADDTARLRRILDGLALHAGEERMSVDIRILSAERTAGERNRAIACLLRNFGAVDDERAALELYLQQCSVRVTCRQLARMGATLAAGGTNPVTGRAVLAGKHVRSVLAMMYACGLFDGSGQFAFDVGLPAKSGISGGFLAVSPGRLAIAAFSPRLDERGSSVRGSRAIARLAQELGLGLFRGAG